MPLSILIGVAALVLLWVLGRLFISAAPATLVLAIRWLVAFLVAVAIGVLVYAGREGLAAALVPALLAALLRWRLFVPRERSGGEVRGTVRMSRAEALRILDLNETATADEVREVYRRLMVKIHPDRGGSTFLAAKINEARDVLLGKK
jgi:hypothetical protein